MMTATAGTSTIHEGYIGHFSKSAMIQVIPAAVGLEHERTRVLAVQEQPGSVPC